MATCGACGGKGYTNVVSKTGAQIPITCGACGGSGQVADPKKK